MRISLARNKDLIEPYKTIPGDALILFLDDGRIYSSHNRKIIDFQGEMEDTEPDATVVYTFDLSKGSVEELIRAKFLGNKYNFGKLLKILKDSGAFLITDFTNMLDIDKKESRALLGYLMVTGIVRRKHSWLITNDKWETKLQTLYNNYQGEESLQEDYLSRSFDEVKKAELGEKKGKPRRPPSLTQELQRELGTPDKEIKENLKQTTKRKGPPGVIDPEDLSEEDLSSLQQTDDLRSIIGKEITVGETKSPKPRKFKPKKK